MQADKAAQTLANLRDIHTPTAVSLWPLAPGWYGLFVLILLSVIMLSRIIKKYNHNRRPKRQALQLLLAYEQQYQQEGNGAIAAASVSELLKRVALQYGQRRQVASLQGDAWIQFLTESSKGLDFKQVRSELLEIPYKPKSDGDLPTLFTLAREWIKQRRGKCLS